MLPSRVVSLSAESESRDANHQSLLNAVNMSQTEGNRINWELFQKYFTLGMGLDLACFGLTNVLDSDDLSYLSMLASSQSAAEMPRPNTATLASVGRASLPEESGSRDAHSQSNTDAVGDGGNSEKPDFPKVSPVQTKD